MLFLEVAKHFEKIENTPSRLEMADILKNLFLKANATEIKKIIYLCQSSIAPNFLGIEIGLGEKFVITAIAKISGFEKEAVEKLYKEKGDLGLVAEEVLKRRKQKSLFAESLTLDSVYQNLYKCALISGEKSQDLKIKYLIKLLNCAKPIEAKYICRIVLGNLRLGIGDPTIMDSLALIFSKEEKEKYKLREKIENAYNIYSDLGSIAELLFKNGIDALNKLKIKIGVPIRPTLAERLSSAEEIIKKIGNCIVEAKYDGFRLQIHKDKNRIIIFSRQSENVTFMFPEIVEAAKKEIKAGEAIIEGEAIAYNEETQQFYPFQITITRKRKYGIKNLSKEIPLKLFVFDIMYKDGENLMNLSFKERRKILEEVIEGNTIRPTEYIFAKNANEIENYFNKCIELGLEGIIAKDINARYIAGARKFAWIKLKRSYKYELEDTIDGVIIGYYKGKGKRTQFGIGALLIGCYSKEDDKFKSIAKLGSGITEEELKKLEEMLEKIKLEKKHPRVESKIEPDVWVLPKYVMEIAADEITKSPLHTCGIKKLGFGLALRFPRMVKFREKNAEESTSEEEIIKMYLNQFKQKEEINK